MAYRATIHTTTKESPYFLWHGRKMMLPQDDVFERTRVRYEYADNYDEDMQARLRTAFEDVRHRTEVAADVSEKYYNKKTAEATYESQDKVYLYQPAIKEGLGRKLTKKWEGLFEIIERTGPVNYRIMDNKGIRLQIVHVNPLIANVA
ncbi:uncharacterized protein [Onthophagus taurus]|uniref:uncharacterized protein n=1 Tax=Onthophagus taurus TaxID=166361 RepID=UPI0039BEC637